MRGFGMASAVMAAIMATSLMMTAVVAQTVDPIVIKGSKFFYKTNGTQFYIRGVAYQQSFTGETAVQGSGNGYVDPLADPSGCTRDLPYLIDLRTNVVRVYAIDPTADHSECMTMFANAGIYVIADLSAPLTSINSQQPAWNDMLYARYAQVVDSMANYTNTLGFFAGNEVVSAPNVSDSAAFVKAAVRDMKAYIAQNNYRTIGVGYATADIDNRIQLADYFNCGDQSDAVDFWGYNIYSWCGSDATFASSNYQARTQEFSSYSVPAFFAEYGCIDPPPRTFDDTPVLLGPQMDDVWSGGIVYMYFQESNDYGLVSVSGNTVSKLPDFTALSSKIASATPTGVNMNSYNPINSPAPCPTEDSNWNSSSSPLPPTPNQQLCSCMYQSLSCAVNPSTSNSSYSQLFGIVYSLDKSALAGIDANGSTGVYGAYSMCNATEQLGFVFNQYYESQSGSNKASACDFNGAAQTQAPKGNSVCSSLLSQAGAAGTGTVTSQPSGTGAGAGASGGSGGGSAAASSSKGGAGVNSVPHVESGLLPMAFIVTLAALSGMGMILL